MLTWPPLVAFVADDAYLPHLFAWVLAHSWVRWGVVLFFVSLHVLTGVYAFLIALLNGYTIRSCLFWAAQCLYLPSALGMLRTRARAAFAVMFPESKWGRDAAASLSDLQRKALGLAG